MSSTVRIGTRSSPMALAQAARVKSALQAADPELTVEVVGLSTSGDRFSGPLSQLGGKGAFVKEVEAALLDKQVDLCVHCVKDIPGDRDLPEGTVLEAYLERDDVRDCVVQTRGRSLADLDAGSRVGTSSPRRAAQLSLQWPGLKPIPVRGNANTRLSKLDAGEYDALLLAVSGLERIELTERISEVLDVDVMLPAVGSGTLAVQCREEDAELRRRLAALDDASTALRTRAERAMLRLLRGHCHSPIAALAVESAGELDLHARVLSTDGATVLESRSRHADPEVLGAAVADELLSAGARRLIDAV